MKHLYKCTLLSLNLNKMIELRTLKARSSITTLKKNEALVVKMTLKNINI